jgi:glycosyltransferase involved in cell wall biosynthesis
MLTVLLATRNRAQVLRDVLEAYCHLRTPSSGWKVVVVDNGSTDETPQVLASFADRLPLHSLCEPKLGKNLALNAGLGLVEGDLTVLTDDDAFPYTDWLVQLQKVAEAQPMYSIFGGAVVPRWEMPSPSWIRWVDTGAAYTLTDLSLKEGPIDPHHVFGPNMAIRTGIFQSGTQLDPAIGPRGSNYPMGSETELVLRLSAQGHKAWHVQGAVVEHFIRKEQLRKDWVFQRATRFGRGQYRLFYDGKSENRNLRVGTTLILFRKMLKQAVVMSAAWLTFRQEALFRAHWRFNFFRGQAAEARNLALQRHVEAELATAVVRRRV